jgi:hypothetical protein
MREKQAALVEFSQKIDEDAARRFAAPILSRRL